MLCTRTLSPPSRLVALIEINHRAICCLATRLDHPRTTGMPNHPTSGSSSVGGNGKSEWSLAEDKKLVGARGFKPPTTCTPYRASNHTYLCVSYNIHTPLPRLKLSRFWANKPLFLLKTGVSFRRALNAFVPIKSRHQQPLILPIYANNLAIVCIGRNILNS